MTATLEDARWMRRALQVAESARGTTRPNPFVGAVVVADDREVGAGATGPAGTAHAEVRALDAAGPAARGATLYVTLEPCAHVGRTPPCTEVVTHAGVARVVVGMHDPNPVAAGGVGHLRSAGIDVDVGVLADRVAGQQEVYLATLAHPHPHVTLKVAQTLQGGTRPSEVGRRWITGVVARRRVHELRAEMDAVLVGSGTVLADDPALTVRDAAPGPRAPRPVVVDRRGRIPASAQVVRSGAIVLTSRASGRQWRAELATRGVDVAVVDDLPHGLGELSERGIRALLAEPGTRLAGALLGRHLVDRLLVHVADTQVDAPDVPNWAVATGELVPIARRRMGDDVEWDWRPEPSSEHLVGPSEDPTDT